MSPPSALNDSIKLKNGDAHASPFLYVRMCKLCNYVARYIFSLCILHFLRFLCYNKEK